MGKKSKTTLQAMARTGIMTRSLLEAFLPHVFPELVLQNAPKKSALLKIWSTYMRHPGPGRSAADGHLRPEANSFCSLFTEHYICDNPKRVLHDIRLMLFALTGLKASLELAVSLTYSPKCLKEIKRIITQALSLTE